MFFCGQIVFSAIKASFKKCKRQLLVCRVWPVKQLRGRHKEERTMGGAHWSGEWPLAPAHHLRFAWHRAQAAPAVRPQPHGLSGSQLLRLHFLDEEAGSERGSVLAQAVWLISGRMRVHSVPLWDQYIQESLSKISAHPSSHRLNNSSWAFFSRETAELVVKCGSQASLKN